MFHKPRKYDPRSMALYLADRGSRVGSRCGGYGPPKNAVTGAVGTAVPGSPGILLRMLTLAWKYIVLNGIFTLPNQCLSIRVWIPLPLSRSSCGRVGSSNCSRTSAAPVINGAPGNRPGAAESPCAGLDRMKSHSGSDTSSFCDPGKVPRPLCTSVSPSLNWRLNNLLHRVVLELRARM